MPLPLILSPGSVTSVNVLKWGKVFLLTMGDDSQFVIKAESGRVAITDRSQDRKKTDFAFQLARQVGNAGDSRALDALEVKNLAKLASAFPDHKDSWDTALDPQYAAQTTWLLMEAAKGLTNLEDATLKGADKITALFILMELRRKANLKQLGKILAVDCFLGNGDRFKLDAPTEGGSSIQNIGNIFITREQGTGKYVLRGLDPLDPSSGWAKLDQDLLGIAQEAEQAKKVSRWPGLKLRSSDEMKELARRVLTDVTNELLDKIKMDEKSRRKWEPGRKDVGYVVDGMKKGRDEIKLLCRTRISPRGGRSAPPAGLRSRMQAMGWA